MQLTVWSIPWVLVISTSHLLASGHSFHGPQNVQLLHYESSSNKRTALESVEIITPIIDFSPLINGIIPSSYTAGKVYKLLQVHDCIS